MPSAPLFDISVTHDYYANLRCEDFAIVPAATTEAAMARLRLTYKSLSDRIRVYAELNAAGDAMAAGAAPLSLDFALRPRSSSYAAITKLRDLALQPAPLFTNDGVAVTNPLPLRLTSRPLADSLFIEVPRPGGP